MLCSPRTSCAGAGLSGHDGPAPAEELPFLATENILMRACPRRGQQELHEAIREYSSCRPAYEETGCGNDLAERLRGCALRWTRPRSRSSWTSAFVGLARSRRRLCGKHACAPA
ncbi:MAG: hypothetical protein ACLUEK_05570 [Oscillospiraceae bacterium]